MTAGGCPTCGGNPTPVGGCGDPFHDPDPAYGDCASCSSTAPADRRLDGAGLPCVSSWHDTGDPPVHRPTTHNPTTREDQP